MGITDELRGDLITSVFTLMIRVGDIVIVIEVRLDKSKVREEGVQLADRPVQLVRSLSERDNLKFRRRLFYKVPTKLGTVACRTLQPVDTCNPFTDKLMWLSFVLRRVCFKPE